MKRIIFHVVIPVLIIAAAAFGAKKIIGLAKPVERKSAQELAPTVKTLFAEPREMTMQVTATGSVVPAKQITLTPEVSGRIVKLSSVLVPGAPFKKGDVIARIDQRDYQLALTQEKSRVQQAELAQAVEAGRGEIAERELEVLRRNKDESSAVSQLARRTPHLEAAKQNTESARSGLARAKLNLNRTVIRAPFNGVVLQKHVDIGQQVGPSTPIVTLMGSDELWINLSVPVEKLPYIDIPGINAEMGSRVDITHRIGAGKSITRAGHVIRLQGQLDDRNRTATVLVSVDDPFDSGKSEFPLLAGAYVTAKIACKGVVKGISLPREALYDGAFVWRVGDENRIQKSIVEVGWSTRDEVVVVAGLETRSQIVVSPIPKPIAGMKVAPLSEATVKTVNAAAGGESVKGRQTP